VRIHTTQLSNTPVNESLNENLHKTLDKKSDTEIMAKDRLPDASQWGLMNDIIYYIAHQFEKPKRGDLQLEVSKVFEL